MESCIKYSSFVKISAIVIGLLTITVGALGISGILEEGAVDGEEISMEEGSVDGEEISMEEAFAGSIVTAVMFIGGGFLFEPICKGLKAGNESRAESLINAIPENNPPERPIIAGRNLPIFTDELVKSHLVLVGK